MASIEKRGENSYRIIVCNGYDQEHKKIKETKTITLDPNLTPKQVEKELKKQSVLFEAEVKNGTYLDGGKITFAEFIKKWLEDCGPNLQPKTLARYNEMLNGRIIPALGHKKLSEIQAIHLNEFYRNLKESGIKKDGKCIAKDKLKELISQNNISIYDFFKVAKVDIRTLKYCLSGRTVSFHTAELISKALSVKMDVIFNKSGGQGKLSDQTIKHHHRLISSILTTAVKWQVLFDNPARRANPPSVKKKEAPHYDEDTTELMLQLLENEPLKYKTMIYVTLYSGCRLGELAGLDWSDIDFENYLIRIGKASQYLPGIGTFDKATKNESSERVISMPKLVMDILSSYKAWWNAEKLECGDQWYKDDEGKESERLFIQWNGKPINPNTITKWFCSFRKRNNLPILTFHGLRHTNASLLIGNGVDVQTTARRLGHSKATTTTNIYSHFLKRPDKEAADKLQNLFFKKEEQNEKAGG